MKKNSTRNSNNIKTHHLVLLSIFGLVFIFAFYFKYANAGMIDDTFYAKRSVQDFLNKWKVGEGYERMIYEGDLRELTDEQLKVGQGNGAGEIPEGRKLRLIDEQKRRQEENDFWENNKKEKAEPVGNESIVENPNDLQNNDGGQGGAEESSLTPDKSGKIEKISEMDGICDKVTKECKKEKVRLATIDSLAQPGKKFDMLLGKGEVAKPGDTYVQKDATKPEPTSNIGKYYVKKLVAKSDPKTGKKSWQPAKGTEENKIENGDVREVADINFVPGNTKI